MSTKWICKKHSSCKKCKCSKCLSDCPSSTSPTLVLDGFAAYLERNLEITDNNQTTIQYNVTSSPLYLIQGFTTYNSGVFTAKYNGYYYIASNNHFNITDAVVTGCRVAIQVNNVNVNGTIFETALVAAANNQNFTYYPCITLALKAGDQVRVVVTRTGQGATGTITFYGNQCSFSCFLLSLSSL